MSDTTFSVNLQLSGPEAVEISRLLLKVRRQEAKAAARRSAEIGDFLEQLQPLINAVVAHFSGGRAPAAYAAPAPPGSNSNPAVFSHEPGSFGAEPFDPGVIQGAVPEAPQNRPRPRPAPAPNRPG